MADMPHDGWYRVAFVDTIANTSAPTVAEITSGVQMECRITPDGLNRTASTERKNTSKLCSTFTTEASGRRSFELATTFVREIGDTAGLEAALFYQKNGFLVVRDNRVATDPWAAGDEVEVYPVQCDQPSKAQPAANEDQTITVGYALTADPVLDAVVA